MDTDRMGFSGRQKVCEISAQEQSKSERRNRRREGCECLAEERWAVWLSGLEEDLCGSAQG